MRPPGRRFAAVWLSTWAVPSALQLTLALRFDDAGIVDTAHGLFWLVVVAASGCVLTSAAVLLRAHRRHEPELGFIGMFFLAVSVLPLVHGIMTPGVLYGENSATTASAQWSIPVAAAVASPLLVRGRAGAAAARIWRRWAAGGSVVIGAMAVAMLLEPELVPTVAPGTTAGAAVAIAALTACVALGHRHLHLARVADSVAPLIVSAGFGFVGASAVVWFGSEPFSIGFWVAHLLDITGVFAGSVAVLVVLRSTSRVRSAIEPVLTTDPMAALELGLDPLVHRFVADLEAKDPITRDHVVRTAELAMAVGTELGLPASELRRVGLTGLLHDVGKLEIPDEILNKPGRLTGDEYEVMKTHAPLGADLVAASPALADIAPLIRSHHERIDGAGYPDGLGGDDIPLVARVVAVCDSFDAMANSRQYRSGMGSERALAILREHAGSQWDERIIEAVARVLPDRPGPASGPRFDRVGRPGPDREPGPGVDPVGCDCLPTALLGAGGDRAVGDSTGGDRAVGDSTVGDGTVGDWAAGGRTGG